LALLIAGLLISPLVSNPRVRLVGFLFGIILFDLVEEFRDRASNVKNFMVLGAYGCALAAIYVIERTNAIPDRFVATLVAVTAGAASLAFCGFGFHGGGFLSRVLSWPPLRWLGKYELRLLSDPPASDWSRQAKRPPVGRSGRIPPRVCRTGPGGPGNELGRCQPAIYRHRKAVVDSGLAQGNRSSATVVAAH